MHDILPPKGVTFESHDLFKYWEISGNISLTVQDRESSNGRLIVNRMWPIECHHCQCPRMTLKVTLLLEMFLSPIPCET